MSKVFVVPDVHLKPWMFEEASNLLKSVHFDHVVLLGDLVDDWFCEKEYDLYAETIRKAKNFIREYNALLCYGNHDLSYIWEAEESGYSPSARSVVLKGLYDLNDAVREEDRAYIHRIDNTLFSHGGLTIAFAEDFLMGGFDNIDEIVREINEMGEDEMWTDDSPIWARPQDYDGYLDLFPEDMYQVVGHTPVREPLKQGNMLTLDTFSTRPGGNPIGDQRFVIVDTEDGSWHYADEDE